MMFDIGWSELLVIGVIALIVVGPKDLPKLLRTVGQYVGQIRAMGREFQRSLEQAAREADVSEIKDLKDAAKELRDVSRMRFDSTSATRSPTKPPVPQARKPASSTSGAAGGSEHAGSPAAPEASPPERASEARSEGA